MVSALGRVLRGDEKFRIHPTLCLEKFPEANAEFPRLKRREIFQELVDEA